MLINKSIWRAHTSAKQDPARIRGQNPDRNNRQNLMKTLLSEDTSLVKFS